MSWNEIRTHDIIVGIITCSIFGLALGAFIGEVVNNFVVADTFGIFAYGIFKVDALGVAMGSVFGGIIGGFFGSTFGNAADGPNITYGIFGAAVGGVVGLILGLVFAVNISEFSSGVFRNIDGCALGGISSAVGSALGNITGSYLKNQD